MTSLPDGRQALGSWWLDIFYTASMHSSLAWIVVFGQPLQSIKNDLAARLSSSCLFTIFEDRFSLSEASEMNIKPTFAITNHVCI